MFTYQPSSELQVPSRQTEVYFSFQRMSVNDGIELERDPVENPPFEYFETRETYAMSFWNNGPGTGTDSTNLIEWVDQQAVRLPVPPKVTANCQGIAPVATIQASAAEVHQEPSTNLNPGLSMANSKLRVYDISTLYALRNEVARKNTKLKIHATALKENIWNSAASNEYPKNHEKIRPRASSNESDQTQRSLESLEEVVLGRNLGEIARPPYRQPIPAPEELHDQKKDGFKRFLKEVASPPHHRVTAGGRIVPTGTQAPPVMKQFDSLEDSVQLRQARHKPSGKNINTVEAPTSTVPAAYNKMNSHMEARGKIPNNSQPYHFNSQGGSIPNKSTGKMEHAGSLNHQMPLGYPISTGAMPLVPLSSTGVVGPFASSHFLGHWNGAPMYSQLMPVLPYSYSENALPMYGPPYTSAQDILPTTARSPFVGRSSVDKPDHRHLTSLTALSEESLAKKRDDYIVKLSDLDKYVALNLHKFTPHQISRNAAKREELVKTIDLFRVAIDTASKNARSSSPHTVETYQFSGKSQPLSQLYNYPSFEGQQGAGVLGTAYPKQSNPAPAQPGTFGTSSTSQSTSLSAAAPPFIPGNLKAGLAHSTSNGTSFEIKEQGTNSGSTAGCNGSIHLPTLYSNSTNSTGGKTVNRDDKISNLGDAAIDSRTRSPFAVPEVDPRDTAYVDRLGLNPSEHVKMFCSTVEEFQEVIRRAREQATTYSCTPGASKDPAHDAEEDIRCAMQNEEAIVLPKPIPDHIANPRPWNWSDSAYNARAHQEFAAFLPAEKVQSPLRSAGSSSRWSNSLHPILEENVSDESGHGNTIGAAQFTMNKPHNSSHSAPCEDQTGLASGKTGESPLAKSQTSMAPVAESKTIYEEYNYGDDAWRMTKGQDWKAIRAPEVKMPHGKNISGSPWRRTSPPVHKKNENTFLQGMLRFPKFCRQNGNAPPSDAEVLAQQVQFERLSASQRTKKENAKYGASGERGVNAKDVFEAARAAFFPKARVSVGPSYQNALGILPPPNQRGSPLSRTGNSSGPSSTQARAKEPAHAVYNSSPLRHVSGQPETAPSSPKGSGKAVHKRQSFEGDEGKPPNFGPINPSA